MGRQGRFRHRLSILSYFFLSILKKMPKLFSATFLCLYRPVSLNAATYTFCSINSSTSFEAQNFHEVLFWLL